MHWSNILLGLAALLIPHTYALFETTYQSTSLAIQPFTVLERSPGYDPDNSTLFLTCPAGLDVFQPGPTIYKSTGELVWSDPSLGSCNDLNFQTFEGEQYLTVWVGTGGGASGLQTGSGFALILNSKYEVIRNISAVNPEGTDLHEFRIPQPAARTALLTAFNPVQLDLTSVGGLAKGWYLNSIIQEIDIDSGRVLFNWTSADHIALDESFNNLITSGSGTSEGNPWDAVHINSIDKDHEGNYLISSRHCKTVYKIDKNGTIIWRLGGSRSDFTAVSNDTEFNWQHHARWRNNETQISVFDDGAAVLHQTSIVVDEPAATGKLLNVDQEAMTVSLAKRYFPSPNTGFSLAEGSTELYGDFVVVGYGSNPWITVHDTETQGVVFSAVIGPNNSTLWVGGISNYRAFQTSTHAFIGHPTQPPSVAVVGGDIYVSWNGTTNVASYTLFTGSSPEKVTTRVSNVRNSGFETKIGGVEASTFILVEALAADGKILGRSVVHRTSDGSIASR
ncbi:ASST-domain-containing protein [Mycena alexandri]|uniref:ASST-domain-containing protein n=1 Tax=Mycena alexandri TaxID=1745969 RepID=A0AAD6SFP7_9AGAR|nr:ASST-domain-containing protein [Mycena alexandri]